MKWLVMLFAVFIAVLSMRVPVFVGASDDPLDRQPQSDDIALGLITYAVSDNGR